MKELVDFAHDMETLAMQRGDEAASEAATQHLVEMHTSGAVQRALQSIPDSYYETVVAPVSRETPTHRKWFIYEVGRSGVALWLHDFFRNQVRSADDTYATSIHNHRYTFASLILSGHYDSANYRFERMTDHPSEGDLISDLQAGPTHRTEAGQAYNMRFDTFHRIQSIGEGTTSLVVQMPSKRTSSFSIDARTSRLVEHQDYQHHRELFDGALGRAESSVAWLPGSNPVDR